MVAEKGKNQRIGTAKAFAVAARYMVHQGAHGTQAELARQLGVGRAYLNDLLQGRKDWPLEHMDRFAELFDLTVPEVVMMGAEAARSGHWFPHPREVQGLLPRSIERAWAIFKLAAADMNLSHVASIFNIGMIQHGQLVQSYLGGSLSDAELYEGIIGKLRLLLERYLTKEPA
jgi:transcriptional regulator with XRE-family HTH domain